MTAQGTPPLIVCFGDSLTAGWQSPDREDPRGRETPYGGFLQARLGTAARVAVSGVCGEVTSDMVERFGRDALAQGPAWVVILGGTNDLGCRVPVTDIFGNLRAMYEEALAAGARPVAVTVPSVRLGQGAPSAVEREWERDHIARREALNRAIADYCAAGGPVCLDLFGATLEPGTGRLAREFSNDGLHLTTAGYRLFADLLYRRLFGPWLAGMERRP
jgi:lysophospholipase L1-like esterase